MTEASTGADRPEVVTLCGSMRYLREMLHVAGELTAEGVVVLAPFAVVAPEDQHDEHKRALDELHRAKIRMSDRVVVVSDESGYHGESTAGEIRYAGSLGLPVEHRLVSLPTAAPSGADDEVRARAVAIVLQMVGAAHRGEEWAHESVEAVVADLDAAGLLVGAAAPVDDEAAVVAEFCSERARYITSINNCHPDNDDDYYRWQGHAEARRQLGQRLDSARAALAALREEQQ